MARLVGKFVPGDLSSYLDSIKVIEDEALGITEQDAGRLANDGVAFLKKIFPKSSENRAAAFSRDRRLAPELWKGWRKYMTVGDPSGAGFMIKHTRQSDERVATVLGALDQGSKRYTIRLKNARAFAFMGRDGKDIITSQKRIVIPARKPKPTREGYIVPTFRYISDRILELILDRKQLAEEAFARKQSRGNLLRARARSLLVKRMITNE